MFEIKDIDKSLSFKLGDQRLDNGDGEIWDLADRLGYITRAYGRLCRNLSHLLLERQPEWSKKVKSKLLQFVDQTTTPPTLGSNGINIDIKEGFTKIEQLYVGIRMSNQNVVRKAIWFQSDKYLDVFLKQDSVYGPDYDAGKIYYTVVNNKLQILPEKQNGYFTIFILFRGEPEIFKINDKIDITSDYLDLLIQMAATEGMQDIARGDKVQLYKADTNEQLQIEGLFIQKKERDEGIPT